MEKNSTLVKRTSSSTASIEILKDLWATCVAGSSSLVHRLSAIIPEDCDEYPPSLDQLEHLLYSLFFLARRLADSEFAPTDLVEVLSDCSQQLKVATDMRDGTLIKRGIDSKLAIALKNKLDADTALADAITVKEAFERKYSRSTSGIVLKAQQKVESAKLAQMETATILSDLREKLDAKSSADLDLIEKIEIAKLKAIANFSTKFVAAFTQFADTLPDASTPQLAIKTATVHALANIPITDRTAKQFHKLVTLQKSSTATACDDISARIKEVKAKLNVAEKGSPAQLEAILRENGVFKREDTVTHVTAIDSIGYSL